MFYTQLNGQLITAFSLPELLSQLPVRPAINLGYLRQYLLYGLYFYMPASRETLYENIFHSPFVHDLQLDEALTTDMTEEEALTQFYQHLQHAVQVSLKNASNVAIELSGGLDSSSVAALVRGALPEKEIIAFTNGPPLHPIIGKLKKQQRQLYYDESYYSRKVSGHLGLQQIMIQDHYHFNDIIEKYTTLLGTFSEVFFPILNHRCYELAQQKNIDTLFSGFGGDEMVSQHAKQYVNELKSQKKYGQFLYEALRSGRIQAKLKSWVVRPTSSRRTMPTDHLVFLKNIPDIVERHCRYETIKAFSKASVIGELSMHFSRRINTSQIIARHYGIDYQFPLANLDLMKFFFHLPNSLKYRHGKGRYLMRRVMKNHLPRSIIQRTDKAGATAPAAFITLQQQLPRLFLEKIQPGYRGLIADYVDIPKLIKHVEDHPIYNAGVLRLLLVVLMLDINFASSGVTGIVL